MYALPNPGAPSGAIKSVQKGTSNASTTGTDITINPVDVNKAFVVLPVLWTNTTVTQMAQVFLTGPTTLNLRSTSGSTVTNIPWQVVEFF